MLGESSGGHKIELVRNVMKGAKDPEVMKYAAQHNWIVVTTETGINHKKFRICTHPGIIVICGKHRHESMQAEAFQNFMLSGCRKKASHAVTFVSSNQARIKTLQPVDEIVRF